MLPSYAPEVRGYTHRMACPKCGGTSRDPITSGYWQCTTQMAITVEVPYAVEIPTGQTSGFVPPVVQEIRYRSETRHEACGCRYRDGIQVPSPPCFRCGTYSIGLCQQCSEPACGDHSELFEEKRLCSSCAATKKEGAAAANWIAPRPYPSGEEAWSRKNAVAIRRRELANKLPEWAEKLRLAGCPGGEHFKRGPDYAGVKFDGSRKARRSQEKVEAEALIAKPAWIGWRVGTIDLIVWGEKSGNMTLDPVSLVWTSENEWKWCRTPEDAPRDLPRYAYPIATNWTAEDLRLLDDFPITRDKTFHELSFARVVNRLIEVIETGLGSTIGWMDSKCYPG